MAAKVSVVIPAHNEAKFIVASIQAVKTQLQPGDEIIVVNNNSTDDTAKLAKAQGVRVIEEDEPGIAPARNTGFNAARNEIIARIDADTQVEPDWLKRIKKWAEGEPDSQAVTGPAYYYGLPRATRRILTDVLISTFFEAVKKRLGYYPLFGSNMAIRRSAWRQVAGQVCSSDAGVHEDLDLAIHLGAEANIELVRDLVVGISPRKVFTPADIHRRLKKTSINLKTHGF